MKNTIQKAELKIIHQKNFIEAEYVSPKLRNQPAHAAIVNMFNMKALKALSIFDTWKDTVYERCKKGQHAYMCFYESTLLYSYFIKEIKNKEGTTCWKVNIMIGTEDEE
jgi:hypothetical protein